MLITEGTQATIRELGHRLDSKLEGAKTLEEAGQTFVNEVYEQFRDSISLLRLFVTIPMVELPAEIQDFANRLVKGANGSTPLPPDSYVLTLLGTTGIHRDWRIRSRSKGHLGIPLVSADFVRAIPMLSALLRQLGFDLGWLREDPDIVARQMGRLSGTFYVEDASAARDNLSRPIIAAQDFVKDCGIRTVFGIGGGYITSAKFFTCICFTTQAIEKEQVIRFQSLSGVFKTRTTKMIADKCRYFR